jgi:hypothetical protein
MVKIDEVYTDPDNYPSLTVAPIAAGDGGDCVSFVDGTLNHVSCDESLYYICA